MRPLGSSLCLDHLAGYWAGSWGQGGMRTILPVSWWRFYPPSHLGSLFSVWRGWIGVLGNEVFYTFWPRGLHIPVDLEHRFELHRSTYMWTLVNKYLLQYRVINGWLTPRMRDHWQGGPTIAPEHLSTPKPHTLQRQTLSITCCWCSPAHVYGHA